MPLKNGIFNLVLFLSLLSSCDNNGLFQKNGNKTDVVALINGTEIKMDELDALIQNQLYESLFGIYYKRKIALEELMAEKVFALESQKRGITKEALLKLEVNDQKSK